MQILFIADIHIKLGQKGVPIEWSKNRFSMFLEQLAEMQEDIDVLILGGDIFDRLPNMEELELYYDMLDHIATPTYIYPGNHEAIKKNTTFLSHLKKVSSRVNSLVTIVDDFMTIKDSNGKPVIDIIPYNKLREPYPASLNSKVLCTHVRGEIPPHVKPEIDLSVFDKWEVVLAGDLHSYDNCQRNILYPGSPMTTSFHRSLVSTGAILFDTDTLNHEWLEFKLPQLLKVTVGVDDDKPLTDFHHTVYEVEGSIQELSKLSDTENISKKVTKRCDTTRLILTPEMSLLAEIEEYLTYILVLSKEEVDDVIKEFNNTKGLLDI